MDEDQEIAVEGADNVTILRRLRFSTMNLNARDMVIAWKSPSTRSTRWGRGFSQHFRLMYVCTIDGNKSKSNTTLMILFSRI